MKTTVEWIPVTDRLPSREGLMDDENKYVLVALDSGIVTMAGFGANGWDECDNYGFFNHARFTHWAPIPEPPKETKDEHRG
nr:MAG TPA: Protein of unknown function (DUF551) [Caudoviricetes sp.]